MVDEIIKKSRILLVEDEESLAKGLVYNLIEEGFSVDWVNNGKKAVEIFHEGEFDLIVLDIMLPYLDGFEVAEIIRNRSPQIPILMLTARSASDDRVKGLQLGADDYLTKPFHLAELLLRIKGMLKRQKWYKSIIEEESTYKFGTNEIDFERLKAKNGKDTFLLTQHEAMVLKYLIQNKGKIVSRTELLEKVWHINPEVETRTVDIFIARLRKYFEIDPAHPVYIKSVRGVGYTFEGN